MYVQHNRAIQWNFVCKTIWCPFVRFSECPILFFRAESYRVLHGSNLRSSWPRRTSRSRIRRPTIPTRPRKTYLKNSKLPNWSIRSRRHWRRRRTRTTTSRPGTRCTGTRGPGLDWLPLNHPESCRLLRGRTKWLTAKSLVSWIDFKSMFKLSRLRTIFYCVKCIALNENSKAQPVWLTIK